MSDRLSILQQRSKNRHIIANDIAMQEEQDEYKKQKIAMLIEKRNRDMAEYCKNLPMMKINKRDMIDIVSGILNQMCDFYDPMGIKPARKAKGKKVVVPRQKKQITIEVKDIVRVDNIIDMPVKKFVRPAAVYSNSSPYGIATEMLQEQLKTG